MKIKQYPEFSEKYPAIDGIKKLDKIIRDKGILFGKNPIRSDVLEILNFDNSKFEAWYQTRQSILGSLLNEFKIVASVPDLRYPGENQKFGLDSYSGINGMIEVLEKGLEYLEIIREIRDKSKD